MTASLAATTTVTRDRLPAMRAFACGAGVAIAAALLVTATGVLPAGMTAYCWLGVGGAAATGALVALLHGRLASTGAHEHDGRLAAMRLQTYLGLGFVTKLVGLSVGAALLWWYGLKFEALAVFALTFVAAATAMQIVAAFVMARALAARALANRSAVPPTPSTKPR